MSNDIKIAVAMSGGLDSSVAALLLKNYGHKVAGFFLDFSGRKDGLESVEKVTEVLGIQLYVIDAKNAFDINVIDWMIAEYSNGVTPNPCIRCNKTIKWSYLYNHVSSLGFSKLATGHYARILYNEFGEPELFAGIDKTKDQSYFLGYLTSNDLMHTQFPLGGLTKHEARMIASKHHLPNVERKESQDLCFLKQDINDFLKTRIGRFNQPGKIVDSEGNTIGTHRGLVYYTIGQRKGLGIAYRQPLYVIGKDFEANVLIVGTKYLTGYSGLIADEVNWIYQATLDDITRAQVKIRYRSKPMWANIGLMDDSTIKLVFDDPVRDIAPGQIAVMYDGDRVLGAGRIIEAIK